MFIIFDLDGSSSISLHELLIIFKSIIVGYCKLTDSTIPGYNDLEKFSKLVVNVSSTLYSADVSIVGHTGRQYPGDRRVRSLTSDLRRIIDWVETNSKAMEMFARFEPAYKIKESYVLFGPFPRITAQDAYEMLKLINKANIDDQYYNSLGKYFLADQQMSKKEFRLKMHLHKSFDEEIENELIDQMLENHAKKYQKPLQRRPTLGQRKSMFPSIHSSGQGLIQVQKRRLQRAPQQSLNSSIGRSSGDLKSKHTHSHIIIMVRFAIPIPHLNFSKAVRSRSRR